MDNEPRISISDVQASEANSGTTPFDFTVSLSAAYDMPVTVNYTTTDGSAKAGTDYAATSGSVVFAPGETTKTIPVLVSGNQTPEANKTFSVNVSTPNSYAEISKGVGVGTIVDNEPRISIADAYNYYGESSFTFTVSLSAAYDQAVTVNFATANGTAIAGVDYVATSGTLTFATWRDDQDDHGRGARPDCRGQIVLGSPQRRLGQCADHQRMGDRLLVLRVLRLLLRPRLLLRRLLLRLLRLLLLVGLAPCKQPPIS